MAEITANADGCVKRFLSEVVRQHRIDAACLYGSQTQGAAVLGAPLMLPPSLLTVVSLIYKGGLANAG
jgi:hypothetical protein